MKLNILRVTTHTHAHNVRIAVYCSMDICCVPFCCVIFALLLGVLIIEYSLKFIRVKIPCTMIRDKCARHQSPEQFQGNRKRYCSVQQQLHARTNYFGILSAILPVRIRFALKTNCFYLLLSSVRQTNLFNCQAHAGTEFIQRKMIIKHKSTDLNSMEK